LQSQRWTNPKVNFFCNFFVDYFIDEFAFDITTLLLENPKVKDKGLKMNINIRRERV